MLISAEKSINYNKSRKAGIMPAPRDLFIHMLSLIWLMRRDWKGVKVILAVLLILLTSDLDLPAFPCYAAKECYLKGGIQHHKN